METYDVDYTVYGTATVSAESREAAQKVVADGLNWWGARGGDIDWDDNRVDGYDIETQ